MPRIKIPAIKSTIVNTGKTSYDVSSSLAGNMSLIQSQILEKTNDYINVKNATNILEKYSNWNGYIKIYTEVENNFNVGDIVYITYTKPTMDTLRMFNLDNNYSNITHEYYDNPFDEHIKNYSFGYKVLFVNKYNNEIVIDRYYNDITSGYILSNQCLSKISLRKCNFFQNIADGAVFYGSENLLCNIFNGTFSIVEGIISGVTYSPYSTELISGATIISGGLSTTSKQNGYYSLNLPVGSNIIKFSASGYTTKTVTTVISNELNTLNVILTGGTNSVTIYSNNIPSDAVCDSGTLTYYAVTVGYEEPMQYQWKIFRGGAWLNIGTNNSVFSYNSWQDGDIIKCEVRDDLDILNGTYTTSNQVEISIIPQSVTLTSDPEAVSSVCTIYSGATAIFTAAAVCYTSPTYLWYVNSILVSSGSSTYSSSNLQTSDVVNCVVNGDTSNSIVMIVLPPTTTTTTTIIETTTIMPTSTMPPMSMSIFEIFGQIHNI
jgi:hypothetical protein